MEADSHLLSPSQLQASPQLPPLFLFFKACGPSSRRGTALVRGLGGPTVALSVDGGDWSSPGCWAWDQRGTGQDGSSQAHPSPAAPHRLSQACALADFSGVLACHSSSWQQEGSSRKWFIIPSFIRSALGSPGGEKRRDVQEEASASDGPVKGLRRWTRPLQPPSPLPPLLPCSPTAFILTPPLPHCACHPPHLPGGLPRALP